MAREEIPEYHTQHYQINKMNNKIKTGTIGAVVYLLILLTIIVAVAYGWIHNIIIIAHSDFIMSGMMALRIVGIFVAPLGVILGYF